MKRYRVPLIPDFDTRANTLTLRIEDDWEDNTKSLHHENKDKVKQDLILEYGEYNIEQKIKNFIDFGAIPPSIFAFHNSFFHQIRNAFVVGSYYPALTAACTLGERILNQLVLELRRDFSCTDQYKEVYDKESIVNWDLMIRVLKAWDVLLDDIISDFEELAQIRHRIAIHYSPEVEHNVREIALNAIHLLSNAISQQFSAFGPQPWFITDIPGVVFIKKEAEEWPFIKRIYLPQCIAVSPYHEVVKIVPSSRGWDVEIREPDNLKRREISDEEFVKLYREHHNK